MHFMRINKLDLIKLLLLSIFMAPMPLCSQTEFKYTGNPLVRHIFTADPTAPAYSMANYMYILPTI